MKRRCDGIKLISFNFINISLISSRSSKNVSNTKGNKQSSNRSEKMNRRIAFIITTDFICWVPFILVCILHSVEMLDASPWYGLFSILILPINSVINPLIYDDTITKSIGIVVKRFIALVSNSATFRSLKERLTTAHEDPIELEMQVRDQKGIPTPSHARQQDQEGFL